MKNLDILKQGLTLVSGAGVREIITNVVKQSIPANIGKVKSLSISTATIVLTSMVTDAMGAHIDKKVDEIAEKIKEVTSNDRESA